MLSEAWQTRQASFKTRQQRREMTPGPPPKDSSTTPPIVVMGKDTNTSYGLDLAQRGTLVGYHHVTLDEA